MNYEKTSTKLYFGYSSIFTLREKQIQNTPLYLFGDASSAAWTTAFAPSPPHLALNYIKNQVDNFSLPFVFYQWLASYIEAIQLYMSTHECRMFRFHIPKQCGYSCRSMSFSYLADYPAAVLFIPLSLEASLQIALTIFHSFDTNL